MGSFIITTIIIIIIIIIIITIIIIIITIIGVRSIMGNPSTRAHLHQET